MKKGREKKEVYLDYAAATPVDPLVLKKMMPFWRDEFANASSPHTKGRKARAAATAARKTIAHTLAVKEREIIFVSGGTEANNIALQGVVRAALLKKPRTKPHILISAIEHPSVEEALSYYEKRNEITLEKIPTTKEGIIDLLAFKKMLRKETILVSTLLVSNKTGVIQPIRETGLILKDFRKKNKLQNLYFHTDASQAPRYLVLRPHVLEVDLLTLDGAKIYGPKGVGILFIKEGTFIEPLFRGGGQESGIRSGTINTPLVVGFAEALALCEKKRGTDNKTLSALKNHFLKTLIKKYPDIKVSAPRAESVSGIISLSFPHVTAEDMFAKLNARGVYTSLGSACESEEVELSPSKKKEDALRLSFGREITKKDIDYAIRCICGVLDGHDIIQKE